MAITVAKPPTRVFVFDSPRTCSNLFRKLFSAHPQLSHIDLPFYTAWIGPESVRRKVKQNAHAKQFLADKAAEEKSAISAKLATSYAEAVTRMMNAITAAERGETVQGNVALPDLTGDEALANKKDVIFIQEHIPFGMLPEVVLSVLRDPESPYLRPGNLPADVDNPTYIPTELMLSVVPVFLIRNPILVVPSAYRTQAPWTKNSPEDEEYRIVSTQVYVRIVFDWFLMHGQTPIVIDAGDLIEDTEGQTRELCKLIGIDPSGVQSTWNAFPVDKQPNDAMMRSYLKQIWASDGVVKEKASVDDLETAVKKWEEEFGVEVAEKLKVHAESEMVTYQYLQRCAIKPKQLDE